MSKYMNDLMGAERDELRRQVREIRERLGLGTEATHAEVLGCIGEQKRRLAQAIVLNDALRAELAATHAEQTHDPSKVSLFSEPDPAQQRPRLALVPVEDPPLELAGEALLEAVSAVAGVEQVSVDSLPEYPDVFVVSVRGGDDAAVARAILRTFPNGSVKTAGNTLVEVEQVVWLARPQPSKDPSP
jgi:hypothetical protein